MTIGHDQQKARIDLITSIKQKISFDIIQKLVEKIDDLNYGTTRNSNPLLCLSSSDHPDDLKILKLFVKKGANINVQSSETGNTASINFCLNNVCLEYLLKKGADQNIKNNNGHAIEMYASSSTKAILRAYAKNKKVESNSSIIVNLMKNKTPINDFRIYIENYDLTADEMYEILICAMTHETHYLEIIGDNMKTRGFELSSYKDRIAEYLRKENINHSTVCFLILNGFKLSIKTDGQTLALRTISKLLEDLHKAEQECFDTKSKLQEYEEKNASLSQYVEVLEKSNTRLLNDVISLTSQVSDSTNECSKLNSLINNLVEKS